MIPRKLFTPRCLHSDRDTVFREDLQNFFNYCIIKLKSETEMIVENDNSEVKILNDQNNTITIQSDYDIKMESNYYNNDQLQMDFTDQGGLIKNLNYSKFKIFWNEKKMSMLHFAKSKEENLKEYYEALYGEVQIFLFNQEIYKPLAIFALYSLYYTQTSDYFYQINIIPEVLSEINKFLLRLKLKYSSNTQLLNELTMVMSKLHKSDALSIGTLLGLKTIILNKYGLPLEQKAKVYKEYMEIDQSLKQLTRSKYTEKEKNDSYSNTFERYKDLKRETVDLIKDVEGDENLGKLYCEFINNKMGVQNDQPSNFTNNQYYINSLTNNFKFLKLNKDDLNKNKITNLDLQFNQVDNHILK